MEFKNMKWNWLVENNYFTEEELQLVTDINGFSDGTLDDMCKSRYGMDWYQLREEN